MTHPGDLVTIRKFDTTGHETRRWQATVRLAESTSIQVEARFNAAEVDRFGLAFRHGDYLLETYFAERWYNVFAVYDGERQTFKGWYCNVSRPARFQDGEVHWVDLGLDFVVLPDRSSAVLDEVEFEQLDLSEADRAAALASLQDLQQLAQNQAGPFATPR
jgi:protein associated with RNAse G/E